MRIHNSVINFDDKSAYNKNQLSTSNQQLNNFENKQKQDHSLAISIDENLTKNLNISSKRAVYEYEENMSFEDRVKKNILEKTLSSIYENRSDIELYPKKKPKNLEQLQYINPYFATLKDKSSFDGVVFDNLTKGELEVTKIEFSTKIEIITPTKSYKVELNLSFSKELYNSGDNKDLAKSLNSIDPYILDNEEAGFLENLDSLNFEFDLDHSKRDDFISFLKQRSGEVTMGDQSSSINEKEDFKKIEVLQRDENGDKKMISFIDLDRGALYFGDLNSYFKYEVNLNSTKDKLPTNTEKTSFLDMLI